MPEIRREVAAGEERNGAVKAHGIPASMIAFPLVLAAAGVILLGLFLSILKLNNGAFIYTMEIGRAHV